MHLARPAPVHQSKFILWHAESLQLSADDHIKIKRHSSTDGGVKKRSIAPCLVLLLICLLLDHVSASALLALSAVESLVRLEPSAAPAIDARVCSETSQPCVPSITASHSVQSSLRKRQTGTLTPPSSQGRGLSNATQPMAFDSGIGAANLTASCTNFYNSFLGDPEVQECHPISLLLMTSNSFFQSTRSQKTIDSVLQASCSASMSGCSSALSAYAMRLKEDDNCGADFRAQNPKVLQAYDGFISYEPTYKATCLKNASTKYYCFSEAVTDASSHSSSYYYYYLPLGFALPADTMPSCNPCLSETMKLYTPFAGNGSTPLSAVFASAVSQTNVACGPNFVDTQIPTVKGAASAMGISSWITGLSILLALWYQC